MNKFFTILRDSYYETADFKLLYVLVGMSLLLTIVVASFPFPKKPVDEVLDKNLNMSARGVAIGRILDIRTVEPLETTVVSSRERYRFSAAVNSGADLVERMRFVMYAQALKRETIALFLGVQRRGQSQDIGTDPEPIGGPGAERPRVQVPTQFNFARVYEHFPKQITAREDWTRAFQEYVNAVSGVDEVTVVELETDTSGNPVNVVIEARLNWAEMPHAREVGFVFGVWKQDLDEMPLSFVVNFFFHGPLITFVAGFAGIIIAIIVTAGFVPNMLQKGTIDFLIVKPISRPALLVYKYLGGLTFVFVNVVVLVVGTWVAFGFTTGVWSFWYLASIFSITFYFGILYSMSVMLAVLTRSQLACILLTIGFWFFLIVINRLYIWLKPGADAGEVPQVLFTILQATHFILPKPSDLAFLNDGLLLRSTGSDYMYQIYVNVQKSRDFSWAKTVTTSLGFIAVMLALASWRFARKDY